MNALPLDLLHRTLSALSGQFQVQLVDIPDCPVFLAAAMPLSPEVTGSRPRFPAGRGLTARQAMTSAAAEAVELKASLARNCKSVLHGIGKRDGFDHLRAADLESGETVAVAAQSVFLDYAQVFGERLITDADSTGCAAAASRKEARIAALLECVERDAVAIWWYGRQSRPHIGIELLDQVAPRLAWWLGDRVRRTRLIDITSEIGIPVVAAVSSEPDGGAVAIGSAAHPDVRNAAVSAVTEMVQTEVAIQRGDRPNNPELDRWLGTASTVSMPQFAPGGGSDPLPGGKANGARKRVAAAGFRALAVDLSMTGDPLRVMRVLVPGLCALNRRIVADRILAHPGGVRSAADFETLEPY
jgi:ribosomal protein S12 methylthiotransferase accessory factor YcaO